MNVRSRSVWLLPFLVGGCLQNGWHGAAVTATDVSDVQDAGPVGDAVGGPTPAARGQMYVERRACAACHQSSDRSVGVLAGSTAPVAGTTVYAPNLTPDQDTGLGTWTDDLIDRAMREGENADGEPLCVMPIFSDMSDEEASAIVAYLRSLLPVGHATPSGGCMSAMDASLGDVDVPDSGSVPPDASSDVGTLDLDAGLCTSTLLINEVQTGGAGGAADEFVEIYNASACDTSLVGWEIRYASATGTTSTRRWQGASGDDIPAYGFVVVAGAGFPGSAVGRFSGSSGVLASTGGGVGLYDPTATLVDSVGYGAAATNAFVEGSPAAAPPTSSSVQRLPDGSDTRDNSADFTVTATPSPGAPNY